MDPDHSDRGEPRVVETLDCLDGLRGIAVLLVIGFHLYLGTGQLHPRITACLSPLSLGYTGVHLFLVLSGFCLTHSLIGRARAGRPPSYRSYFSARWRRIGPPYYAAMAVYLSIPALGWALGRSRPDDLTFRQIATHLTFTHGLFRDTVDAICIAFWSLSLEFQFYLVLPFLVRPFLSRPDARGFGAVLLAIGVMSLAWRLVLAAWFPGSLYLVNGFVLGRLTEFAMGIAVAFWFNAGSRGRWADSPTVPLVGSAVLLLGGSALPLLSTWVGLLGDFAVGAGYALLLVAALVASKRGGWLRDALGCRWLTQVGAISYSLYLIHSLIIVRGLQVCRRLVPGRSIGVDLVLTAALFVLVMLSGWIFFAIVERHFVRSVGARSRSVGPSIPQPTPAGSLADADPQN